MKYATDWNRRYQTITKLPPPSQVLAAYTHLLPATGIALDLACGLGANALLLARHGLETYAWDYAETALEYLQVETQKQDVPLHVELRDIVAAPPPPNTFDVLVVCHFLNRDLAPALIAALKPNGLLFYQTFRRTKLNTSGPKNPEFRLAENELLHLFDDLRIIIYREEGEEALLIAKK